MSKFNTKVSSSGTPDSVSYEGGGVFKKSVEDEWINLLFSSMLKNSFYELRDTTQKRYIDLTDSVLNTYGPEFVAKAAVYSRNVLGLRSVSTLTAAIVNNCKFEGKRYFYSKYFRRPDDIAELFSAVDILGQKRSHGLIRGAKDYLSRVSEYQIGKYKLSGKNYNMYDLINLTHANSAAIDSYKKGTLDLPDTWEVNIGKAKSDEERLKMWKYMVSEHRLGYLALLRNLNNILKLSPSKKFIDTTLSDAIVSEQAIRKSLVYPFQIYIAYTACKSVSTLGLDNALSKAFELSVSNVPRLGGSSLLVLDVSGSMSYSDNSTFTPADLGAVYGSCIALGNPDCDIVMFGTDAVKIDVSTKDPFKMIDILRKNPGVGNGTCINSVFDILDKHYDRMFMFSDMQVMDGYGSQDNAIKKYHSYTHSYGDCKVYSFDLEGYGTQILRENDNISYISALNDKVFDFIKIQESGKTLIDMIKNYSY